MAVVRPDTKTHPKGLKFYPRSSADRYYSCKAKSKYPTEADARKYGARSLSVAPGPKALYPYACSICRCWHLTKQENGHEAITP